MTLLQTLLQGYYLTTLTTIEEQLVIRSSKKKQIKKALGIRLETPRLFRSSFSLGRKKNDEYIHYDYSQGSTISTLFALVTKEGESYIDFAYK